MINVNSKINLNFDFIRQLEEGQVKALEETAEHLHSEVVQAQVVPRMDGALQGESFFLDKSQSASGKVSLVHSTPYARRLYYHPEYNFHTGPWDEYVVEKDGKKKSFDNKADAEAYAGKGAKISHLAHEGNPHARGKWFEDWLSGSKADDCQKAYTRFYKRITGV